MTWSLALGLVIAVAGAAGFGLWRRFTADMSRARARLTGRSQIAPGRLGPIEYAVAGAGPPVLVIHGTGGGFDQALAMSEPLIEAGYRIIAPSRFGYLRAAFPADPSSENQADAFADLLGALGIDRVAVIGGSAGALSAIQFALRHPQRCIALLPLVPATYAPDAPKPEPLSPLAAAIMRFGLRSDFVFWLGLKAAPRGMIRTLLATDPRIVASASADEQARVKNILWAILPVSARLNGLINDARLVGELRPVALDRIAVPTLAISLADDGFHTYAAARHIAATVPGARMIGYPRGGHVWVGHHREMFGEIDRFLKSLPPPLHAKHEDERI